MATISIDRTHELSHRQARELAARLAKDLEERFGLAWRWEGDDVHFTRPGVSGLMHVGKNNIALEVRLGLLLTPLRHSIEKEIHAQLELLTRGTKTA